MCSVLKKECRLSNFSLNGEEPKCFTSPWKWPVVFVIYRFILAAYYLIAVIVASLNEDLNEIAIREGRGSPFNAPVYLTSWNIVFFLIHFIWAAAIAIYTFIKNHCCPDQDNATNNDNSNNIPWYSKVSWVLASVVSSVTVIVTAIYFGAIHDSKLGLKLLDLHVHGLPIVFIVVDNFISARPVRLLHFIFPLLFGIVYLLFTVINWAVDQKNAIYPEVLDWKYPGKTFGVAFGIGVVIVLAHAIYFGLYRLQLFIHEKFLRGGKISSL